MRSLVRCVRFIHKRLPQPFTSWGFRQRKLSWMLSSTTTIIVIVARGVTSSSCISITLSFRGKCAFEDTTAYLGERNQLGIEMRRPLRTNETALYYSYIVMGFADFAPWRCLVAALDYFNDTYPGKDPTKWMTVAYWAPSSFALLVVAWIPAHKWQKSAVIVGFVSSTSVLILIPLMDFLFTHGEKGSNSILYISLSLVVILGSTNAVLDACVLGSSMNLPSQYPQAYATGLSLSALFVSLLRLFTKSIFSGAHDGLKYGAYVFFFLCSFSCLIALLIYLIVVQPHSLVEKFNSEELNDIAEEALEEQAALMQVHARAGSQVTCANIAWLVKVPATMLAITMIVNIFVNPGIIVDAEWKPLGDWFKLLLLVVFAVSETLGRTVLAKHTIRSEGKLCVFTVGRVLIMASSVLVLEFLSGPIFMTVIVALTGFSFGYHALSCYCQAQAATKGAQESQTGGSVILIAECAGAFLGSLLTLARTEI